MQQHTTYDADTFTATYAQHREVLVKIGRAFERAHNDHGRIVRTDAFADALMLMVEAKQLSRQMEDMLRFAPD